MLFHLALTFGLEQDPVGALEQAIGLVEATAVKHGIENAVQASMGLTDGERLWAFRYSTAHQSRTLFVSAEVRPSTRCTRSTRGCSSSATRIGSSSPSRSPTSTACGTRSPSATVLIVQPGPDEQHPFRPHYEPAQANGAPGTHATQAAP